MSPNDADGKANSADPDQTALGAVWSGSALFAQAYLSENLGSITVSFKPAAKCAHWPKDGARMKQKLTTKRSIFHCITGVYKYMEQCPKKQH